MKKHQCQMEVARVLVGECVLGLTRPFQQSNCLSQDCIGLYTCDSNVKSRASIFAAVSCRIALRARTAQVFRRARARLQTWAIRAIRAILARAGGDIFLRMIFLLLFFCKNRNPVKRSELPRANMSLSRLSYPPT